MPDDSKNLEILIKSTTTGDGLKKTEEDLKKVDAAAKKSGESFSFATDAIKKAEEGAAAMGKEATAATGSASSGMGLAGMASAGVAAAAAVGIANEAMVGLEKMAPTLGKSLSGIGGAIHGAFQEVMGGSLHTALSDLFGKDFEARLQRIAQWFGVQTAQQKLMGQASADYVSKQRTMVELMKEENEQRALAATHAKNLNEELINQLKLEDDLRAKADEERKAAVDRDPNLQFRPGDKSRTKGMIEETGDIQHIGSQEAQRAAILADIDRIEREAAEKFNTADARAHAASKMGQGDNREIGNLTQEQAQKIRDAIINVAKQEDYRDAEKAQQELAALLKVFQDARIAAADELQKTAEAQSQRRVALDQADQKEADARLRKDREDQRTAPERAAKEDIEDIQGDIALQHAQAKKAGKFDAEQVGNLANDPGVQKDPKSVAALQNIQRLLQANAEDQDALKQLADLMPTVSREAGSYGQQIIAILTQQQVMNQLTLNKIQSLSQELTQAMARLNAIKTNQDTQ